MFAQSFYRLPLYFVSDSGVDAALPLQKFSVNSLIARASESGPYTRKLLQGLQGSVIMSHRLRVLTITFRDLNRSILSGNGEYTEPDQLALGAIRGRS